MCALVLAACSGGVQNNDAYSDYYNWVSLGSLGMGWNSLPAMAFDLSDHKLIAVFEDMSATTRGAHSMKWQSGTSWTDLGLCGGDGPSVACDLSGNPIVASMRTVLAT